MVAMSAIAGLLESVKSAIEIAKSANTLRSSKISQHEVRELYSAVISLSERIIDAEKERAASVERIRQLEEEVANLKAWGAEKENYELKEFGGTGALAYVLKTDAQGSGPAHYLCANCYKDGKKSILQPIPKPSVPNFPTIYQFPECHTKI